MDLIYSRTDQNGNQTSGFLSHYEVAFDVSIDLEYVTNNFELKMILPDSTEQLLWSENTISSIIYVEGTEYGGEISGSVINVAENTITYTGRTWRGNLSQQIIEPPAGQDYRTVSGNLATSMRTLPLGPYISVQNTTYSGGTYQFARYVTTLEGATGLITAAQSDLRMTIEWESSGYGGEAKLYITPARDLRSTIEVSQDYNSRVQLQITRDGNTPRELICLGEGELKDREVIKLYADENWNISTTPIAGVYPVETYDFSGSENLLADGRKLFLELIHNHEQIEVTIADLDIRLSDIIGAKDFLTGEFVSAEITSIVWRCVDYGTYQEESFEYITKVL